MYVCTHDRECWHWLRYTNTNKNKNTNTNTHTYMYTNTSTHTHTYMQRYTSMGIVLLVQVTWQKSLMWQVGRHIVIKSYPSMSNQRGIEVPWKGYSDQKRIFCQLETQFPSAGWTEVDKINASRHIDIIQFISFITDNAHSIFSSGYVSALSGKDNKCTIQSQCKFT